MTRKIFFYFLSFIFYLFLSHPVSAITTASLSVNPPLVSKKENESFPLEVRLAVSEIVVGIDLDISFDPNLVEITKITPGSFFANPQILTNNIDNKKGEVKFSVFSYPGKSGSDSLVNLEVKLLSSNFVSTYITVEKNSVISGQAGKKIEVSFGKTTLSPSGLTSPTQSISQSTITYASPSPGESSPTPTISAAEPTIFLADQVSPKTQNQTSKRNLLGILAFGLIVLGIAILFLVVLFLRKSVSNAKE